MISILDDWVKGHHGVEALHPCWHSLVYVVADAIGGGNPAAANNIAKNWKGMLYPVSNLARASADSTRL